MDTALKSKLDEAKDDIAQLKTQATEKWTAWETARDAFAASGKAATDVASDEFKAADTVHREYSETVDQLDSKRSAYERLLEMAADGAPRNVKQDERVDVKDMETLLSKGRSLWEAKAAGVIEGEGYKRLLESGMLDSKEMRVHAHLGKMMSRDEFKALLTGASDTSGGAFVVNDRQGYYPKMNRPLLLSDLITIGTTDSDTVEFVQQTTQTHAAAEVAEATSVADGAKPESTYAFQIVQTAVQTIAHWVPATKRSLRDAGQLRTIIEAQLRVGLEQRLETQEVAGNGTAPNLRGIMNTTGVGTYAKGTAVVGESSADALHRGLTITRLTFNEPTAFALHPNDWEDIRLSRDDSGAAAGTGGYLFGPPSVGGADTLWGLPVAVGAQFVQNTGLVGDFRQAILWLREGIQILASDSHSDFFIRNLVAVLAEMAAAFGVVRPDAFTKVTGI